MLKKLSFKDILVNDSKCFILEGVIRKICIRSKEDLYNVKVHIETGDNEVLFSDFVGRSQVIYPKNIQIINNVIVTNDVYVLGAIYYKIQGLEEGQKIDEIIFIVENSQETRETF